MAACTLDVLTTAYVTYSNNQTTELLDALKQAFWSFMREAGDEWFDMLSADADFAAFLSAVSLRHCSSCNTCEICNVKFTAQASKIAALEREWKKLRESTDKLIIAGKMSGAVFEVYDEYIVKNVGAGVHLGSLHTVVDYARFVIDIMGDKSTAYVFLNKVASDYTFLGTVDRNRKRKEFCDFDARADKKIDASVIELHEDMLRSLVHGGDRALKIVADGFKRAVELADAIENGNAVRISDVQDLVDMLKEQRGFTLHRGVKPFAELQQDSTTIKTCIRELVEASAAAGFTSGLKDVNLPQVYGLIDAMRHFVPDPNKPFKR